MSITDELRKYAGELETAASMKSEHGFSPVAMKLTAIADHIDAEHENGVTAAHSNGITEYGSMVAREFVKLPVDADGVPWHLGDVTEDGNTVLGLGLDVHGWHFVGTVNDIDPAIHRHHRAPTVEDVLREACNAYHSLLIEGMSDVAHDMPAPSEIIAEYSAKLRLANDGEEL